MSSVTSDPYYCLHDVLADSVRMDSIAVANFETVLKNNGLVVMFAEKDRGDGRKQHYGAGRQPLDDIDAAGWGGPFAAGNVLKYLRRDKTVEESIKKARWYWKHLNELVLANKANLRDLHHLKAQLTVHEFYVLTEGVNQ